MSTRRPASRVRPPCSRSPHGQPRDQRELNFFFRLIPAVIARSGHIPTVNSLIAAECIATAAGSSIASYQFATAYFGRREPGVVLSSSPRRTSKWRHDLDALARLPGGMTPAIAGASE